MDNNSEDSEKLENSDSEDDEDNYLFMLKLMKYQVSLNRINCELIDGCESGNIDKVKLAILNGSTIFENGFKTAYKYKHKNIIEYFLINKLITIEVLENCIIKYSNNFNEEEISDFKDLLEYSIKGRFTKGIVKSNN